MNRRDISALSSRACHFFDALSLASVSGESVILPDTDTEDHIELGLDVSIISSHTRKNGSLYRLSEKLALAHLDFTCESFILTVTALGGAVLFASPFRYDGRYFFDENVSFFIKDASLLAENHLKERKIVGCSITVPDDTDSFKGTKSVLSNRERLVSSASKCFGCDNVFYTTYSSSVNILIPHLRIFDRPVISVTLKDGYVYASISEGTDVRTSSEFKPIRVETNPDGYIPATKLADALCNIVSLLSPEIILLDRFFFLFGDQYTDRFKKESVKLNNSCYETCKFILSETEFSLLGCAAVLRNKYSQNSIRRYLNSEKGRKLWNITQ